MKYFRVTWGDNNGYVYYISDFSNFGTAIRFIDYVESLGWCAGSFDIIKI